MAKVSWGGADLEDALNEWEPNEFQTYAGDRPPRGVYQFKLQKLEAATSTNGFPQLIAHWVLEPSKPDHRKFKGYYMRDYIVVKEDGSTAFRVRPLLDALGVTVKQFRQNTVDDNEGNIIKMGPVRIPGNLVMCAIKPDRRNSDYEHITYLSDVEASAPEEKSGKDDDGNGDDDVKAPF